MTVRFTVLGRPQPQGSAKAFMPKGARFPVVTSDNKTLKPWRHDVALQAQVAMQDSSQVLCEGPIWITCRFFFLKPKSTSKAVQHKLTKPDLDKCVRSILDSLTGVCFRDDSQVVRIDAWKFFCTPRGCGGSEGVEVEVFEVRAGMES